MTAVIGQTAPTSVQTAGAGLASAITPGIVRGLEIRVAAPAPASGVDVSHLLVVHPGLALGADGRSIGVDRPIGVDLASTGDGQESDLILVADPTDPAETVRARLQPAGHPPPAHSVRIAVIAGPVAGDPEITPVHAGLGGRRLTIGAPGTSYLVVDEGRTTATGTMRIIGGNRPLSNNGCLIVGPDGGDSVRVGADGIDARSAGRAADLFVQTGGGRTRFGGSIEGPDRQPLTITGGTDLSLGGGGVLMLGQAEGPNLVLDENEVMARDDGRSAPLTLQCDGGETRFGGPLRGTDGGPLRIVGGSDLSLGGAGVVMVGEPDAQHLVLDENELMAGTGASASELYIQWRGGGTSFGGPISGERNGSLSVQPAGGVTRFGGPLEFRTDDRPVAWLDGDGTGRLATRCDRSSMHDPVDLTDALAAIGKLRPVVYRTAPDADHSAIGLLAEEVARIAPELVSHTDDGAAGLRPLDLAVLALAAIAELQQRIEDLES